MSSDTVRIVGSGLLGASIGHALQAHGVDVVLADASPAQLRLAIDYGAGRAASESDEPTLIVVAVPPDVTASVVATELERFPDAVVTEVASVKSPILEALTECAADLTRYVGSHPMAGRERGGAIAARADLFTARPWVVCPSPDSTPAAVAAIRALANSVGAFPIEFDAAEHDRAVAYTSHVPQVVSSLLAARLSAADPHELELAGGGVRDTTRIAASDPGLWEQILSANAMHVVPVLDALAADLDRLREALHAPEAGGARRAIAETIRAGNDGVSQLPGKHGVRRRFEQVVVMVDDTAGQLGRLFGDLGELGVNIEDFRMEHSPGAPIGLAELSVIPQAVAGTVEGLQNRGWRIASTTE